MKNWNHCEYEKKTQSTKLFNQIIEIFTFESSMIVKIRFKQYQIDFKKIFQSNHFKNYFKKSKKIF